MCLVSKKIIKSIFILSLCILQLSCSDDSPSKPRVVSKVKENTVTEDLNTPSLNLTGMEVYKYQVEIKWPKNYRNVRILSNNLLMYKSMSDDVTSALFGLEHNKDYKIQIYGHIEKLVPTPTQTPTPTAMPEVAKLNESTSADKNKSTSDEDELLFESNIKTPLDVFLTMLTAPFGLSYPMQIKAGRIFIIKDVPIITNGYDLDLDMDEFIILDKNGKPDMSANPIGLTQETPLVDAAIIETFPKSNIVDHINHDGKSGGIIKIKSKKANGKINFYLRGQNGLDGENGKPHDPERASNGANGERGFYTCMSPFNHICMCDPKTADVQNGQKGADGLDGNSGKDAGNGGNSGVLSIEIAETKVPFQIAVMSEPGSAGKVGIAGPPQKAGVGGVKYELQRNGVVTELCPIEPINKGDGKDGNPGVNGNPGKDGIPEPYCVSRGDGFGRCNK